MLTEIAFTNIRNLQAQQITLGSGINLILGDNAAGKSSVLEALHLLSLGRSFRTTHLDQVITQGEKECWVRGRMTPHLDQPETLLGFRRSGNRNAFRIDGKDTTSVAQVARLYPVQIIHPETHRLITGGPSIRRSYLDWGCFYAFPDFHHAWRNYRRALVQYNAALKQQLNALTLTSLETELAVQGQKVDRYRSRYLDALLEALPGVAILWPDIEAGNLIYLSGWRPDHPLDQALKEARPRSLHLGSALVGPHRSDLKILHKEQLAADVLSRGLIKRVTLALMLAQIILFEQHSATDCTLMIDDFSSELDDQSMSLVAEVIQQRQAQSFITALSLKDQLPGAFKAARMFHVKHGSLNELV